MVDDRRIPVYALNIAAMPHPDGIYPQLLRRAANIVVRAHGSDWARITAPESAPETPGVYTGRIQVWTEIDLRAPWYDITRDAELSEEIRKTISIPPNAKPNYRAFDYVFGERKHRLYFEARNEHGKTLGPTVARRIRSAVLSQEVQGLMAPSVEVTLVPKEGTVKRILAMPGLRTLTINVLVPNPDTTDAEAEKRVRKRLADAKARSMHVTYTKQRRAKRLTPTPEIEELATVAAKNGFVSGEGVSGGKPTELSTSDEPRREYAEGKGGVSFLSKLINSVGLW